MSQAKMRRKKFVILSRNDKKLSRLRTVFIASDQNINPNLSMDAAGSVQFTDSLIRIISLSESKFL